MGRMSEKYYRRYFELLEDSKNRQDIRLGYVVRELNNIDTKIQFSFSSKLIHIVDHSKPIYDSKIARFYMLPEWNGVDFEDRLSKINHIYDFLIQEYKRIKEEKLLYDSIDKVRTYYNLNETFSDEKIIDSIIWMFINYGESSVGNIRFRGA